jgi:DNA-binding MurR/RpiR family transcriptional regulator
MTGGAEGALADNPLLRIRAILPETTTAERRVAESILADPSVAVQRNIIELALLCDTSTATVVRLCRRAGYAGYRPLRLALAAAAGRAASRHGDNHRLGSDIDPSDPPGVIVRKLSYAAVRALEDTAESIDPARLQRAAQRLAKARTISIYGLGASRLAAQDLQQKLSRIRRCAQLIEDAHHATAASALLRPGDVVVGISNSGNTAEVVEFARAAAQAGADVIALTNYPNSSLAVAATITLTTSADEGQFRPGAMASRIAQSLLIDSLFVALVCRTYRTSMPMLEATHAAGQVRRLH